MSYQMLLNNEIFLNVYLINFKINIKKSEDDSNPVVIVYERVAVLSINDSMPQTPTSHNNSPP